MKLLDVPLLWQQLDGPQAKALIEGARGWLKSWATPMLEYFENWSLETVTEAHLDLIGWIMGVPRPVVITLSDFEQYFRFWNPPTQSNEPSGFDGIPRAQGGILDTWPRYNDISKQSMTDNDYRFLLKTIRDAQGEKGSLLFLDSICYAYVGYQFNISSAYSVFPDAMPGDVWVHLTTYNPAAYIAIQTVLDTFITPFPKGYIDMAAQSS